MVLLTRTVMNGKIPLSTQNKFDVFTYIVDFIFCQPEFECFLFDKSISDSVYKHTDGLSNIFQRTFLIQKILGKNKTAFGEHQCPYIIKNKSKRKLTKRMTIAIHYSIKQKGISSARKIYSLKIFYESSNEYLKLEFSIIALHY